MQAWVREKLDQLAELFPPARLNASKERWRRLWQREPPLDRLPFVYHPAQLEYYSAGHTAEQRLRSSLDEFLLRGRMQDDFVPALFPGCHQGTIPGMFGAEEIVRDGDFTCRKLLRGASQIATLPDPSLAPASVAGRWLAMEQHFLEETEGRLPIHTTDMQGPVDVCGQLWNYEDLFVLAYEDPAAYTVLVNKAADAFSLLWEAQRNLLGEQFVGTHLFGWDWVPAGTGASLSADSLVMISPDFYAQHYQPCLEQIGRRFLGLTVHSCGIFSAVIRALCRTPGVKGINAGQMGIEELLKAGVDSRTVIIAGCGVEDVPRVFQLAREEGLRLDLTIGGIWRTPDGAPKPLDQWTSRDWDFARSTDEQIRQVALEKGSRSQCKQEWMN